MAPESATEGRPITQPRPVLVDSTCTSRCGVENGGPARLIQCEESFSDVLDVINVPRPLAQVYYLLKPDLLSAFSVVGAVNKAYTFKEVLIFLKHYLKFKKLINPLQPNTIVCKDYSLGKALGVDKFEFHETRDLLLQNLKCAVANDSNSPHHSNQNLTNICSSQRVFSYKGILSNNIYIPSIPEPLSDPESDYSYQGYETALCRSDILSESECQSSDVEEYDVVSEEESAKDQKENDSDSDVESIILELYYTDCNDTDEEFFADESDSSTDNDSEVSTEDDQDHWSCLTCGVKNKPFMRYCLKCWELRKDWLPEPPKRHKKRKPRPKKYWKKSSQSLSDLSTRKMNNYGSKQCELEEILEDATILEGSVNEDYVLPVISESLIERSDSLASTASTACSSQDSGFCSQEYSKEEVISPSKPSVSNHRKRKFSVISDGESCPITLETFPVAKTRKVTDSTDNVLQLKRKLNKFTETSEGQRWLLSSKVLEVIDNVSSESETEPGPSEGNCIVCFIRPKNASIIHGRLSHIGVCYPCAKKLFRSKQKCPICRRKIHMITKNSCV